MIRSKCQVFFLGIFTVLLFNIVNFAQSEDGVWTPVAKSQLRPASIDMAQMPNAFKTFRLNKVPLESILKRAPREFTGGGVILTLPMPDGTFGRFQIEQSLVVEPGLLEKYPELGATYRGRGIDDPTATARFDFISGGFHSMVISASGTSVINPYQQGDTDDYISFNKKDSPRLSDFKCDVGGESIESAFKGEYLRSAENSAVDSAQLTSGATLRTYRLAVAATNEYASAVGGNTIAGTLAAQVLIMNRVNGVYERDLAIHMNIVANNNLIVYAGDNTSCDTGVACTGANDPYTNNDDTALLSENQTNIDAKIGSANYDIGHVFSTAGGGRASVGVPCRNSSKASGETGLSNPVGDTFAIDYVAHEMGHQFGANHTFNGTSGFCSGNRSGSAAFEVGSGITVMGYAGICDEQDLAFHSIDTFHVRSLEEIVAYSQNGTGNTCAVSVNTGNTPPTVPVVGGPFNIPKQTPFSLTASATDADNGDSLTYDWQEYDLGSSTTAVPNTDAVGGARPIFRPYAPSTNPTRTFPSLQFILNNANVPPSTTANGLLTGELMPQISRAMKFQVIVRDNHPGGGGFSAATANVNVDGNSGPFKITSPNTNVSYAGNSAQTITWDVANTAASPVNAANVKISYSVNGGQTFPVVLAENTPNDGSEVVTIPAGTTNSARIKIEAVGNIFFDISDVSFSVTNAVAPQPKVVADFDGDRKTDFSVWRESSGIWFVANSAGTQAPAFQFGSPSDKLVPGDYDGDGKTDMAVWRPSGGLWYLQRSSAGFSVTQWGVSTDLPVQGDFDGDGKTDIAVWRPSSGIWFVINSGNGQTTSTQFGVPEDRPVAGDYDGDGKTDLAVFRPSSGIWFILRSSQGFTAVQFGIPTDKVVPGDYDGDGKTDLAVYRDGPQALWYLMQSTAGFAVTQFGTTSDVPVPGDFDGDGKADISVWRPSNGIWFTNRSSSGFLATQFGQIGDKPVPASYIPLQ